MKRPYTCEICQIAQSEGNLMYQVIKALTKEISAGFPSRGGITSWGAGAKSDFLIISWPLMVEEILKEKSICTWTPNAVFRFPQKKLPGQTWLSVSRVRERLMSKGTLLSDSLNATLATRATVILSSVSINFAATKAGMPGLLIMPYNGRPRGRCWSLLEPKKSIHHTTTVSIIFLSLKDISHNSSRVPGHKIGHFSPFVSVLCALLVLLSDIVQRRFFPQDHQLL